MAIFEAAGIILRNRCHQRRQPENQQIDLIGEPPPELVADKSGNQCTQRHADKGQRNELQILRSGRELGLDCGRQHATGDIEIISVENIPAPTSQKIR
jgi:hypothetical protein